MTSIAVKLEKRIAVLIGRENEAAPRKVSYVRHYLTYLVVRCVFRAIFSVLGKMLTKFTNVSGFDTLKYCLYIFIAISMYFPLHAYCCFEELKVN